ncbi:MAG: hypothetical protein LBV13_05985 [Methanomassiliicoccaceae archaeon]|jgi:hypothetical protein|nr:hypothetical protein [Methanomassiliicoccaceae archaeon]
MQQEYGKLPAGRYYIGDACYMIRDWSDWSEFCSTFGIVNSIRELRGQKVCRIGTAHGDGSYRSNIGKVFDVDSGAISCVPEKLVDEMPEKTRPKKIEEYVAVEFLEEFTCAYINGVIVFGNVHILTDDGNMDLDYDDPYDIRVNRNVQNLISKYFLTYVQARRYQMYKDGLGPAEIARREDTTHVAIIDSLNLAKKKIEKG